MAKSVLVTGSSTGLGLEIALYLAEQGFDVYASMRDLSRRGELDARAAQLNVRMRVLQLDVTDRASIKSAVEEVIAGSGGIYALVNNAGVGLRGYFEDLAEDEIRGVFEANVFGTMWVTQAVLPYMRRAHQGRIIVVGSVGGRLAAFGVSAYCSTKFAQEGFAEALAQEVAPFGIGVSLIEPGITKTERWKSHRAIARKAQDRSSAYYSWFLEGERLADRLVETSPTKPVDVAKATYEAIQSPSPRLRYVVGWRASLVLWLRRYVPQQLFERIYFGTSVKRVTRPKVGTVRAP
jgi:NAD(P)-dependent dehydrogenase (short-subunit alcohol dehydrogenase family)